MAHNVRMRATSPTESPLDATMRDEKDFPPDGVVVHEEMPVR